MSETLDPFELPTESLIERIKKTKAQRDELLAACRPIIEANDAPGEDPNYAGFLTTAQANSLRTAIAKGLT